MRRYLLWSVLCCLVAGTTACGGDSDEENNKTMMEENAKPVASIQADAMALVGSEVSASASGSSDADGDSLTYSWSLDSPEGSSASLSATDTEAVTFTPDVAGDYTLTLTVNDGTVDSDVVTATVTVGSVVVNNQPPVSDAGADVTVTLPERVNLDGSGSSDPDGDTLTYAWELTTNPGDSSAQQISGEDSANFSFTPDVAGEYVATLTVSDGQETNASTVTITVLTDGANSDPVADAGDDFQVTVGAEASFDGSNSSDPDGDDLTYAWAITTDPSNGTDMLTGADTATPTLTPSVVGEYVLTLTVTDTQGATSTDEIILTVNDMMMQNQAPVADAGAAQTVTVGDIVSLDGSASTDVEDDAAGTPLTYAWAITTDPSNGTDMLTGADTATPTLTPSVEGAYELTLTVTDSAGDMATATVAITVQAAMMGNQAPVADAGMNQTVATNSVVMLDGSASTDVEDDAAGTPLTYAWAITTDPSNGMAMLSDADTAMPSFTPMMAGDYVLTLTVTDSAGDSAMSMVTITVQDMVMDLPPVADVGDERYLVLGSTSTFDGSNSTDAEDDMAGTPLNYAWTITTDPSNGMDMLTDANTEAPSITPSVLGTYEFTLTVTDSAGNTDNEVLTLNVIEAPEVIIGERIEGSSNNKALELFNPGATDVDLAPVSVATLSGSSPTTGGSFNATGTLVAGQVFTLCHMSRDTMIITTMCDGESTSALNYNGDDVTVIYVDQDGVPGFDRDSNDFVLDAWGEIGVGEASRIYNEKGYNRCDFTPFDGRSPFVFTTRYTENDVQNDFSDLGTPPVAGCGMVMNLPPMADAGADQIAMLNDTVTLDGSASTDPEDDAAGTPLVYSWAITADPSNGVDMLTGADTATPSITLTFAGTYEFTLTVTDSAGDMATDVVEVISRPPMMGMLPPLFISELVEGSSSNKAIEIFNGSDMSVDLTDVRVSLLSNGANSTSSSLDLTGMLMPGDVLTICNTSLDPTRMPPPTLIVDCDIFSSSVTNFNGNDTVVLFIEDGTSSGFNPAEDAAIDAFGQIGVDPGGGTFANAGYQRCDFTQFDGGAPFTAGRFTEVATSTGEQAVFSTIGVAPLMMNGMPVSTCPGSMP